MKKHYIILTGLLLSCYQIALANINPQPRIINGKITQTAQIPSQVAIVTNPKDAYQSYICSGSLIADNWVVTAAHCVEELRTQHYDDIYIMAGTNDLQNTEQGQILKVKQYYIHEHYNHRTYDNDIALLQLEQPIDLQQCGERCQTLDWINPTLEQQHATMDSPVQIAGWGVLEDCENSTSLVCQQYSGKTPRHPDLYPTTLRYTTLKLNHCLSSSSLYRAEQITNNMFCAESPIQDKPTDTCFGDSGAGLIIQNGLQKPYLLGVASWGVGCAKPGYAGVYTRIANYHDWLNSYINPAKEIPPSLDQTAAATSNPAKGGSTDILLLGFLLSLLSLKLFKINKR